MYTDDQLSQLSKDDLDSELNAYRHVPNISIEDFQYLNKVWWEYFRRIEDEIVLQKAFAKDEINALVNAAYNLHKDDPGFYLEFSDDRHKAIFRMGFMAGLAAHEN